MISCRSYRIIVFSLLLFSFAQKSTYYHLTKYNKIRQTIHSHNLTSSAKYISPKELNSSIEAFHSGLSQNFQFEEDNVVDWAIQLIHSDSGPIPEMLSFRQFVHNIIHLNLNLLKSDDMKRSQLTKTFVTNPKKPYTLSEANKFIKSLESVSNKKIFTDATTSIPTIFHLIKPVANLPGTFLITTRFKDHSSLRSDRLRQITKAFSQLDISQQRDIVWFEPQLKRSHMEARSYIHMQKALLAEQKTNNDHIQTEYMQDIFQTHDPHFLDQWHLYNNGSGKRIFRNDINVIPVWKRGFNGTGITVAIVDDGVDYMHPDFSPEKWSPESSYDFSDDKPLGLPVVEEDIHGTRCAGEIASQPDNGICGVGVAFGVRFASERIIAGRTNDAKEAMALSFKPQINDIYSSSWGPSDNGKSLDGPGTLAMNAILSGISTGRHGRGSIFVFASGNGGLQGDNCNFDGYANSVYTIAIGSIHHLGGMPAYGEECAAHLAVTYSGGGGVGIWTTDVNDQCTGSHSGTSAAAPIAAGMIALMLSARPELGWRDVQQIIVDTAQITDPSDTDWVTNGAGYHVSHKYGFGKLNAELLVNKSLTHQLLPSQPQLLSKASQHIPDPRIPTTKTTTILTSGLKNSLYISGYDAERSGLSVLQHVQVTVSIQHPARRFLTIKLISPSGTSSILAAPRFNDKSKAGYKWTFMTVRCWGESPVGEWTLVITDSREGEVNQYGQPYETGILNSWTLTLYGSCHQDDMMETEQGRTCATALVNRERKQRKLFLFSVGGFSGGLAGFGLVTWCRRRSRRKEQQKKWMETYGNSPSSRFNLALNTKSMKTGIDQSPYYNDIESPTRDSASNIDFDSPITPWVNQNLLTPVSASTLKSPDISLVPTTPVTLYSPVSPLTPISTNSPNTTEFSSPSLPSPPSHLTPPTTESYVRKEYLVPSFGRSRRPSQRTGDIPTFSLPSFSNGILEDPISTSSQVNRRPQNAPPEHEETGASFAAQHESLVTRGMKNYIQTVFGKKDEKKNA